MRDGDRRTVRWGLWGVSVKEHIQDAVCTQTGCGYIVEEHQRFDAPEGGDVPEFTIEVAFKTKNHAGNSVAPGWRFILKWRENGELKQARGYGYQTNDLALNAAKHRANQIALSILPVHVETYRPEI